MRVIGIDPGTAILGWGVVELGLPTGMKVIAYGCLRTPAGMAMPERLRSLYRGVSEIVRCHQPQQAAVEQLFFGQNVTTALTVGQARGVVLLAFAESHIPILELTPAEVKVAITGYGKADKRQVQEMVMRLLELPSLPSPDDIADALAIAMAGGEHLRYRGRLSLP